MRFFKYLVLIILSIFSVHSMAYWKGSGNYTNDVTQFETLDAWCSAIRNIRPDVKSCRFDDIAQGQKRLFALYANGSAWFSLDLTEVSNCPARGWPVPVYLPKGTTRMPIRLCKNGCSVEGSGLLVETNGYTMTPMQFTGDSVDCNERYKDDPPPPCNTKDPYGECFVPPKDDCVRLKDGSIQCPDDKSPPNNNTCNGADYCKRPPQGCGEGYVSGTFNGQLMCVRSGPNKPKNPPDPDKPDDPNNCMNGGTYCPQPPDNTKCPSGYSETTFNGSKICVKDNPDPEKPNPNDPNNPDYGGGGDNGSGGSEPTGGGDGSTGGSVNLKPVIDAINALKASLLNAMALMNEKLISLVNGQKETNQKLDTSNEHLDKIEDATLAASESLGDLNDSARAASEAFGKVFSDQGKEQIEQLGQQSSDPRYAQAEAEATTQVQKFANVLSYTSSHACISDLTITNIPLYGSMTVPLSKWCDLLALVKILMKLAVLMLALRMIDATVRAF